MQLSDAERALDGILEQLRIISGSRIVLGIDMARVPLPTIAVPLSLSAIKARKLQWCEFVLDRILHKIGPDGTLIVPAFSYSCGKAGSVFNVQSTPSENGPFPEYVRCHTNSIRSLHPIFSLSAIGKDAADILYSDSGAAFGPTSPFGKFAHYGVRFLTLGIPFSQAVTYIHHLEQSFGCNHRYNKVINTPVVKNGSVIKRTWLAYLRYLSVSTVVDLRKFEAALLSAGALHEVRHAEGISHAVDVGEVDRVGYALLSADPWAFSSAHTEVRLHEDTTNPPLDGPVASFQLERTQNS